YGINRIERPVLDNPRRQSTMPVAAVASAITIKTGGSKLVFPPATSCAAMAAASVAVTAEVDVSGPAIANGSELRNAVTAAATAADRKVTAMPWDSQGFSGPEKMSAA